MKLAEKQAQLVAELSALKNGQDRLALLVTRAKNVPGLAPELRTPQNLVPGCLAKLWLTTRFADGECSFSCHSDSLIVKAIAGLLCELYSGQPPAEILAQSPDFLAPLGITQHLTPNRRNALSRVWETIRQFAGTHATG
jgi:cysteine desulfuration protein SufE